MLGNLHEAICQGIRNKIKTLSWLVCNKIGAEVFNEISILGTSGDLFALLKILKNKFRAWSVSVKSL